MSSRSARRRPLDNRSLFHVPGVSKETRQPSLGQHCHPLMGKESEKVPRAMPDIMVPAYQGWQIIHKAVERKESIQGNLLLEPAMSAHNLAATTYPDRKEALLSQLRTSRATTSLFIIINPLTARVVVAPQMILQKVFSIFPCSPLPSGTCRTPGLSIP